MKEKKRMPPKKEKKRQGLCLLLALCLFGCASAAHRLNDEGVDLARAGKYEEAVQKFDAAIQEDPHWGQLHLNLARTYLFMEKPEKAIGPCEKAIDLSPKEMEAYLMLAQTYLNLDQKKKADDVLKKLERIYPDNDLLCMVLGDMAMAFRNWDEAIARYQKSISLNSTSDMAYFQLGRAYLMKESAGHAPPDAVPLPEMGDRRSLTARMGNLIAGGGIDLDKPRAAFRKAVYLNPKHLQAHIMLGLLALYTASYEEAQLELTEAVRIGGENGFLCMALGMTAQKMKKFDQALELFAKAQRFMPGHLEPKVLLIFLEVDRKNYVQAAQRSMEILKEHPQAREDLFGFFASDPPYHVPWLLSVVSSPEASQFAAEALSFISKRPFSLDTKAWEQWWEEEKKRRIPPHSFPERP